MSITESGLRRVRMSWEEFLELPERPRAEWVDGEVVVSPPSSAGHGATTLGVASALRHALAGLFVTVEAGLWLPGNRLRGPDVMVLERLPEGPWVEDPPVLVVEVLSPSTRSEDTVRKSLEYAAGGIGQYWVVDPEARALDVFENVAGSWEPLLRLDDATPAGEVAVGAHGVVPLDLREILPPS